MAISRRCVVALTVATALALNLTVIEGLPDSEGNFGGGLELDDPCFKAADPKLWPLKPESHVCGTDGLLYPSENALKCAESKKGFSSNINADPATPVTVQSRDKCGTGGKAYDICRLHYGDRKVCGTDNVTYQNFFVMACTANKYSVEIGVQSVGECKIDCPYSPIYKPVCSSPDDKTLANEEDLKCLQMKNPYSKPELKHVGKCKSDQSKYPCLNNDHGISTVCASNGRTYANVEAVRCLKESNPALEVLHEGACTVQEVEKYVGLDDICRMDMHANEFNPLCGSDNVTYSNAYTFLCAAKSSPKDKKLQVTYEGECFAIDKCPNPPLPTNVQTVCGSDGVNYPSENAFNCAKFKSKILKKSDRDFCHNFRPEQPQERDPCLTTGPSFIVLNLWPVCGSNKVTYNSKYDLLCAAKTKPEIKLLHTGECV